MDLHPYDGIERCYHHTHADQGRARELVGQLLGLAAPPSGPLLFDLRFYSGGIGIQDRLAITVPASDAIWPEVEKSLRCVALDSIEADRSSGSEIVWLFAGNTEDADIRHGAVTFINSQRREFQSECIPSSRILIERDSDMNDWAVVWGDDRLLNYLGYCQG